jgi:hypothetical protein
MIPAVRTEEENAAVPLFGLDQILGEWITRNPMPNDRRLTLFGGYLAEVSENASRGIATGKVYKGLLDFGVEVDFEKATGRAGA